MTDKATQALYRAWGAFAATPLPAEAPQTLSIVSPECDCAIGGVCSRKPCAYFGKITPANVRTPLDEPFAVHQADDAVAVWVTERPLTLLEAQDLTARLLIVTGPMWAATIPKGRL